MRLHLSMRSRKVPLQRVRVGGGGVASGGHFYHHDIPGGGDAGTPYVQTKFRGPGGSVHTAGLEPRERSHRQVSAQISPAALLRLGMLTSPRGPHGPRTRRVSRGKGRHGHRNKGRECRAAKMHRRLRRRHPRRPPRSRNRPESAASSHLGKRNAPAPTCRDSSTCEPPVHFRTRPELFCRTS